MNFKKTAVALAMGMMVSGGAMAQVTINLGDLSQNVSVDPARIGANIIQVTPADTSDPDNIVPAVYGLELSSRFTSFSDIVSGLGNPAANVTALAASLNEVALDGSIEITGDTISFSAIENVTASANATSSNIESATATARAINGNSLATTVIGAMGTADFENRVSDMVATDFAAQAINSEALDSLAYIGTESDAIVSGLGNIGMVSASVNTGELMGNIEIIASNTTPTWFLNEATVASVSLTNLDAATTVIGAMNTTNAVNEVMRNVNLKTAVQVIGAE